MRRSITPAAVACFLAGFARAQEAPRTIARLDFEVAERPALSPDGRYLAVGAWERGLYVIEVATGRNWAVLQGGNIGVVDWSPRGDQVAMSRWDEAAGIRQIWTVPVDLATGRAAGEPSRVSVHQGTAPAYSPDGQWIAFANSSRPGTMLMVVPARGGRERVLAWAEHEIGTIAWSDDGQWIYFAHSVFGSPRGLVSRVRVAGGSAEAVWETPSGRPCVAEPGPMIVATEAGQQFGFSNEKGSPHTSPAASQGGDRIRVIAGTGRDLLATIAPPPGEAVGVCGVSGDGSRFYTTQGTTEFRLMSLPLAGGGGRVLDAGPFRQVFATSTSPNLMVFLTQVGGRLGFVAMAPDGSRRREFRPRALPATRPPHHNWHRLVVAPDGNHLAYAALDTLTHLVVLDLRTGAERRLVTGGSLQFRWMSNTALQVARLEDRLRPSRLAIHQVTLDGTNRLVRVLEENSTGGRQMVTLVNDTMAFLTSRELVELVPLPTGSPRVIFRGHTDGPVGISSDQRLVAIRTVHRVAPRYGREESFIDDTDAVAIVDLTNGQRLDLPLPLGSPRSSVPAVWHPDGRHLMITMARSTGERDTYLVPVNGDRPRVIAPDVRGTHPYPHLIDGGRSLVVTLGGRETSAILELIPSRRR